MIFYSTFDEYSKKTLETIVEHKLTDLFHLVCVDNKKIKLPEYVDCVPYIITKQGNRIFDEHVEEFIQSLITLDKINHREEKRVWTTTENYSQ